MTDRRQRVAELDGIRGIAIALVLLCHAEHEHLLSLQGIAKRGWIGVDLFFVLSGTLITGILLDTRAAPDRATKFYARRFARIWPVWLAAVALGFAVWPALFPQRPLDVARFPLWPYLTLTQNFVLHRPGLATLAQGWSLCVEEQFYLVWPALVWLAGARAVPWISTLGILAAPFCRAALMHQGWTAGMVYRSSLSHCDGLFAGALLACCLREPWCTGRALAGMALGGLAVLAASLAFIPADATVTWPPVLLLTGLAVGFAGLVAAGYAAARTGSRLGAALRWRPLRLLGKYSYALYLLQFFAFYAVQWTALGRMLAALPHPWGQAAPLVAALALAIGAAALSWRWFEQPILDAAAAWTSSRRAASVAGTT
jgi:peptidoglycan/LPS O-acetylase OafA/YrhL